MKRKRGISPLIATVLLVGFAITLAALTAIWWGGYVKERAEKASLRSDAEAACLTDVEIDVKKAEPDNGKLDLTIRNKKSQKIAGFTIRVHGDTTDTVTATEPILGNSQESFSVGHSSGLVGSIEVIPIIMVDGLAHRCSEQAIRYSL